LSLNPNAQFPAKLRFLFKPKRYKVAYGGRGGTKSWGFARALLILGAQRTLRILCARETQKSIADSVHKLLSDQVANLGLEHFYEIQNATIIGQNGTEFTFAGLKQNISNLKSYEGCDICWVEEAQTVSKHSWEVLIPTIRKENSEIWVTFNPDLQTDETYKRFVLQPPPNSDVVKVNWTDNPWFPETLRQEKDHLRDKDPDSYENVWEGICKQVVQGAIYRNELLACEKEGRICRVPYDPIKPVHTFWDLGFGDNTSIWFAQSIGFEFRLIDYLSGSQQGLQYYLRAIKEKPYIYGIHHLPHDARAHELGSGRSIEEQIRSFGHQLGWKVQIVPKLSIEDGIAAARAIFSRCWIESEKCADGIQALRHYRYESDDKLQSFKREPLHDWASHPADAFRYFAVAIREPERQREEQLTPVNIYGTEGWMALGDWPDDG
jgi:phage terminase large subunit